MTRYSQCESIYVRVRCMLHKDHHLGRASEPDLTDPRWHRAWNRHGNTVEWVDPCARIDPTK